MSLADQPIRAHFKNDEGSEVPCLIVGWFELEQSPIALIAHADGSLERIGGSHIRKLTVDWRFLPQEDRWADLEELTAPEVPLDPDAEEDGG